MSEPIKLRLIFKDITGYYTCIFVGSEDELNEYICSQDGILVHYERI